MQRWRKTYDGLDARTILAEGQLADYPSAMNLGLGKNASTGLRAEAVVLGEMNYRGSYDWGLLFGSSGGAMGSNPRSLL